jgi:hypothetical protein
MSAGGMPVTRDRLRQGGGGALRAAFSFVLFAGGCLGLSALCAASPTDAPGRTPAASAIQPVMAPLAKVAQAAAGVSPDANCPAVEVRRGAATLTVGPTGERSAMTLKYQGSFTRFARECSVVDGNMIAKVGVEGRIVVGPAGSAERIQVPLRFAVVRETPTGMQAIATKFVQVSVDLNATGNTPFVYVEEGLSFPIPNPVTTLDEYLIYVGFDPVTAEAQSRPAPKAPPKQKQKPQAQPKPKSGPFIDGN